MKNRECILAISANHDTGIVVHQSSEDLPKGLYCINEERISRKKLTRAFPEKSLAQVRKKFPRATISRVLVSSLFTPIFLIRSMNIFYSKFRLENTFSYLLSLYVMYHLILLNCRPLRELDIWLSRQFYAIKLDVKPNRVTFLEHHRCHAASAYYACGLSESLVITLDMMGDGLSVSVSLGKNRKLHKIFEQNACNGLGAFYGKVTLMLGHRPSHDEGKITGLAAYGRVNQELLKKLRSIFQFEREFGGFSKTNYLFDFPKTHIAYAALKEYPKEDCAATCQLHFEEQIVKFIDHWMEKTRSKNLAVAGGLFANVKLNQKIHELASVQNFFVFPHMGDGGLAFGALVENIKPKPFVLRNLNFGPEYSDEEIRKQLLSNGIPFTRERNIEKKTAQLLANGYIVARFSGRMEFGPRALGNRSVFYTAVDKNAKDRLNRCLDRTEFMPFAPILLDGHARKCFVGIKGAEYSAQFMTMTFNCTDYMKKKCPGAVHVDGTARPQILRKASNPPLYRLLQYYYKFTNVPAFINTSFNRHGEPIVCSPQDAIRTFKSSGIDYLAIGNYLIKK